ncbi:MAG: SWIM zinc finger family protein [Desulfuromonadales bacterium]
MSYYELAPYVPVAERRAKALKQMEKLRKKGLDVQPVELTGRKIAGSFWGKGWCDHMESFSDYANRLPRGRTYVRNGSVCHLTINQGRIEAMVSGTQLYNVAITISPLLKSKWDLVKKSCTGRIGSLIDLLRGKLDHGVMEVVADRRQGLFPLPGEMKFDCDCPDWAGMCKHVAAVLYGVGARLDQSPEMLFVLRGVNHEELVDVSAAVTDVASVGTSRRRIAASGIADVFGIDMAESAEVVSAISAAAPPPKKSTPTKKAAPAADLSRLQKARLPRAEPESAKTTEPKRAPRAETFPDPLTGDAIHAWRTSRGETQTKFAARIGVTAASISQWEKKGKAVVGMQPRTLTALRKAWQRTHR